MASTGIGTTRMSGSIMRKDYETYAYKKADSSKEGGHVFHVTILCYSMVLRSIKL